MKKIDLTGKIFGRLTVLSEWPERTSDKKIQWLCKCNCGKEVVVRGANLRKGKTKSCGCYNRDIVIEMNHKKTGIKIGDKIKEYLILDLWYKNGESFVKTYCPICNNEFIVSTDHLKSGHTKTCRCSKKSLGEIKIKELLQKYSINFVEQKTFENFRYQDSKIHPRFDFYIDNKYIIEFDGIQHFKANGGWNSEENVALVKQKDKIKNQWCRENNIPLIRIPYTHLDKIELKDLLLETSDFVLQGKEILL